MWILGPQFQIQIIFVHPTIHPFSLPASVKMKTISKMITKEPLNSKIVSAMFCNSNKVYFATKLKHRFGGNAWNCTFKTIAKKSSSTKESVTLWINSTLSTCLLVSAVYLLHLWSRSCSNTQMYQLIQLFCKCSGQSKHGGCSETTSPATTSQQLHDTCKYFVFWK